MSDLEPDARARALATAGMLLALAAALALLYVLSPMLTPFALAAVLAYLVQPAAAWLQRHDCNPTVASGLLVLLILGLGLGFLVILLPLLEREAVALYERLPGFVAALGDRLSPLLERGLGVTVHLDPAALQALALQHVGQQDALAAILARFGNGGLALLQVLLTLVLVPVALFYLLLDGGSFAVRLQEMIPLRWQAGTRQVLGEIDSVLAQFLRGQVTVMLLMAAYYCAALELAGLESALAIGLVTGLLIFIPYVGYGLGLLLASIVALMQFPLLHALLLLAAVYGVGEILEGFVLTPRLVGQRIGLHPLVVIFALLAFGQVFGFLGVLIALPASAILLVALRHVRRHYLASAFYQQP